MEIERGFKMKKIFSALMIAGLATTLLVGCGSKAEPTPEPAPVEDAAPEVEADEEEPVAEDEEAAGEEKIVKVESEFDERGWKQVLEVTFDGDTIVAAHFDYENEAGDLKSEDEEYNTNMKEKSGVSAAEAMDLLTADLVAKQDPNEVDVVSGATGTSEGFIALAKEAVEQK